MSAAGEAVVGAEGPAVLYSVGADGVAIITLNRPKKLNGWSAEVIDAFVDALRKADDDDACTACVMASTGR